MKNQFVLNCFRGKIVVVKLEQTADAKARVTLPEGFANAPVILEQLSDAEVRIRKAKMTPGTSAVFPEETITTLSDRDRDLFLRLLENPPKAIAALRKAMAKHQELEI